MNVIYGKDYDETNPLSIEKYAQGLIGKTFNQVCEMDIMSASVVKEKSEYKVSHENNKRKGVLG